jgi:hypothetical protein
MRGRADIWERMPLSRQYSSGDRKIDGVMVNEHGELISVRGSESEA